MALAALLILINSLRATGGFLKYATVFNVGLMFAGFSLTNYQLAGFFFA